MTDLFITLISIPFVLFLPGLLLSFVFFSKKEIDILERIALSIALSLAVVPLVVFYTNLIGIQITQLSVIAQIIGIMLVTLGVLFIKRRKTKAI